MITEVKMGVPEYRKYWTGWNRWSIIKKVYFKRKRGYQARNKTLAGFGDFYNAPYKTG
jgi:hypothetical protein